MRVSKKILVLGGSYLQSHFIKLAISSGNEIFVADENPFCYASIHGLGKFVHLNFSNKELVTKFCLDFTIESIIAPVNELGNVIAAQVSEKLGFYYNSAQVVERTTDKKLIWCKLKNCKLNQIIVFSETDLEVIEFPVIVKPTVSTGSKGVTLVTNYDELKVALKYARSFGKTSEVRIEEFIEGQQYSLETITFNGKHYLLAVIEEHLNEAPFFFERSDILDQTIQEKKKHFFKPFINLLLEELEIKSGPCHIEVKVRNDEVYLIDFASRSGGWRDIMLKHAGIDFNALILSSYLQDYFDTSKLPKAEYSIGAGILTRHADILKLGRAQKSGKICERYLNGEVPALQPKSLADAYGYYFLKTKKKKDLKGLLPTY